MRKKFITFVILYCGLAGLISEIGQAQTGYNQQWPSFRGPGASGYLPDSKPPARWDINNPQAIKWKTAIPGLGHSSPVIWNNYLFVICGYDFENGEKLWRLSNGGDAPAPTPVIANDLIYLNSAHGSFSPVFVVRPDAKGDITLDSDSTKNHYIVWSIKRGGAYMQTPLIYEGLLYNLNINGILTCFDALNGETKYKENFREAFSASAIAADGKIYFTSEAGNVWVVKAGPEYSLIAKNSIKDNCMATPAISGNTLFFRSQHYVIAIE